LVVKAEECGTCHPGVESEDDLATISMSKIEYDGDGDTSEGIAGEVATVHEALLAAIKRYAATVSGALIVYDPHAYPYFFVDTNYSGEADGDEAQYPNKYNAWTPRLLKAAYNYQYVAKDPGAYAHNGQYVLQALYDSLESLGEQVSVDMTDMVRP
jgi:hypothetical protein